MSSHSHTQKHSRIDAAKRRREEKQSPKDAPQKKRKDLSRHPGPPSSPTPTAAQGSTSDIPSDWDDDDNTITNFAAYSSPPPPQTLPIIEDIFYINTTSQQPALQTQTGHDLFSSPTDSAIEEWYEKNSNASNQTAEEEVPPSPTVPGTPAERNATASPSQSQTVTTNEPTVTATPTVPLIFTPLTTTTPNSLLATPQEIPAPRTPRTPATPEGVTPSHSHREQNTPTGTDTLPTPPPNFTPETKNSSPGTGPAIEPASITLGTQDTSNEGEEDEIASLLKSLGEQSSLAGLENAFGAFSLVATPFSDIQIPMDVDEATLSARKPKGTQWIKLTQAECTPMMLHKSGNPHDFIADTTLAECKKAFRGEEHKLGNTKAILVDPGFKMIVRIVHRNCPHAKHQQWIKHAIRSALASAESPLEGAMSIIAMGKPSYDWHVISLTKAAYEALQDIRALFDPRSRVLVLLRLWKMEPETTQILNFAGVVTEADLHQTAQSTATALFRAQMESTLSPYNIAIEDMETVPDPRNPVSAPITCVTFKLTGIQVFTLNPKNLPKAYNGPGGRPRTITPSWPRRCPICHSEAHLGEKCPWITKEFDGATYGPYNANNLSPGQTERAPKRKREDTETTESGITTLTDIRPISRVPKIRKTEAPTAMDIDQPSTRTPPSAPATDITPATMAIPTATAVATPPAN